MLKQFITNRINYWKISNEVALAGDFIFVSGQVPIDENGVIIGRVFQNKQEL